MTDTREFTDADGIAIVYDVHPAVGDARGVVQLLHGVGCTLQVICKMHEAVARFLQNA